MQDVRWLSSTEQPHFLNQCWRTDFFKERARHDPWLTGLLKRLTRRPHAVAKKSDPRERYMFSTFWNVWIFHEHDNDYIHDLGILHELIHTVLFEKKRAWGSTPQAWAHGPLHHKLGPMVH